MDWKKRLKKLLYPPVWVMVMLTLASAVGLAAVFANGWEQQIFAYLLYAVAFYTLTAVSFFCAMVLPKQYQQIRQRIYDNPLGSRYMTDQIFRARVSLNTSLTVNLLYAAVNVVSWFLYRSWWFVCLAVYYATLSVMRFLLVRYVRMNPIGANRRGELKRAIACSVILLTLNFFLSGAVLMILYQGRGYEYGGILIYVMAMYTFYQTTHAIIDMVKYRKMESPVMSTAKIITMASALVSMLNLETAMFASFGADMAREDQNLMIMLTGGGVSLAVIAMAVATIRRCGKEIKGEKNGE